jgi:tRNA-binding protein
MVITVDTIDWEDFEKVQLRIGTVSAVHEFPEARKPAYKLEIDFGDPIGRLRSSAQVTALYTPEELVGRQVLAVVNFPPKQIGPFMSECLVTGVPNDDGDIVLVTPDVAAPNGARLM